MHSDSEGGPVFEEGEIVAVESGEYSDRAIHVLGRVLVPFNGHVLIRQWQAAHPEPFPYYDGDLRGFAEWLVEAGYLEPVLYDAWWIGAYGTFVTDRRKK